MTKHIRHSSLDINSEFGIRNSRLLFAAMLAALTMFGSPSARAEEQAAPRIFMPYSDLSAVIDLSARNVLLDRRQFALLLADAMAAADARGPDLGQVADARYVVEVAGDKLALTGTLTVTSLSDKPVAVPLHFARIGLTSAELDGRPAPLGYDSRGRLTLIVTGRGNHKLAVAASTVLKEPPLGGTQFGFSIPPAVAGTMKLSAAGDLEIHATVPASGIAYHKATDRTTAELAIGGQASVTVALMGNGRAEEQKAILLGESVMAVQVTPSQQILRALYTVQVLRTGVRELRFLVPDGLTVSDVLCANMVRWSIDAGPAGLAKARTLTVRLRTAARGTQVVEIHASCPTGSGANWASLELLGADFLRGYLLVNTAGELRIRGEKLTDARREDLSAAAAVAPALIGSTGGRLYYHWGAKWSVDLDLIAVALSRASRDRQIIRIAPELIVLDGRFEVTAIGKEMFQIVFELPSMLPSMLPSALPAVLPAALPSPDSGWSVQSVQVNGGTTGFEYHLADAPAAAGAPAKRTLTIELASPVPPEGVANVSIVLLHVPGGWNWDADASARRVAVPLIRVQADTIRGVAAVSSLGDLETTAGPVPAGLAPVTVGRMGPLGLGPDVQSAWTYEAPPQGELALRVTRGAPRLAAEAVGLVSVTPTKLIGDWRINYDVTRAQAGVLYLLADKSLEQNVQIDAPGRRIVAKAIVAPGPATVALAEPVAKTYDLWQLKLDGRSGGRIPILVRYEQPFAVGRLPVPLIRPIGVEQASELLAVQAGEELAVAVEAADAVRIDAIDIPSLPAQANRVLEAFRLKSVTPADAPTTIALRTTLQKNYAIPTALVNRMELKTLLDPAGGQQTEAVLTVANANVQFLRISFPPEAVKDVQLWSAQVDGQAAKPRRQGDDYLLALPRSDKTVVKLLYALLPAKGAEPRGRVALVAPRPVGIQVNQSRWTVSPPPGYLVSSEETRMTAVDYTPPKCAANLHKIPDEMLRSFSVARAREAAPPRERGRMPEGEKRGITVADGTDVGTDSASYDDSRSMEPASDKPSAARKLPAPTTRPEMVLEKVGLADWEGKPSETEGSRKELRKAEVARIVDARIVGRFTLPVELPAAVGGRPVIFEGLGEPELTVGLTGETRPEAWLWIGLLLTGLLGLARIGRRAAWKTFFIIVALAVGGLMATWEPATAPFANGIVLGALLLVPLYLLVGLVRGIGRWIARRRARTTAAVAALLTLCLVASAFGQGSGVGDKGSVKGNVPPEQLVIPYDGDAAQADKTADKVLVPYARFVELWNLAHLEQAMVAPAADGLSVAAAKYRATVEDEKFVLVLTCQVKALTDRAAALPLPVTGLAFSDATLDGKPASLQMGPSGPVLLLKGNQSGLLKLTALGTPKYLGRKGSIDLALPPLPGAMLTVAFDQPDLVLEAPGVEGAVRRIEGGGPGVEWAVPLGAARSLALRWMPKVTGGEADRTLTAAAGHDVFAFHWALVGVSRFAFSFSAGEYDRFTVLLPSAAMLTHVEGLNLRDHRIVGASNVPGPDGKPMKLVEVRLHRPAARSYDLTLRWLTDLPALDKPARLPLPQADEVGKESGTVTLHAAGGMGIKVAEVIGGRRTSESAGWTPPAGSVSPGGLTGPGARALAGVAHVVGSYQWPYRPFALVVQLSRLAAAGRAVLDQLVRVGGDRIQLLVRARLTAIDAGAPLFAASFALPDGYELLSVTGPAVGDWFVQPTPAGKRAQVNLRTAATAAELALVLVRNDPPAALLANLPVPMLTALDSEGVELPGQAGRLAVQLAAALDGRTLAAENLEAVPPSALAADWLEPDQVAATRFAYEYDRAAEGSPVLRLAVAARRSKVRVEILSGVNVQPSAAWFVYRLRYTIDGSPIDRVSFTLPSRYASRVAVFSPALRSLAQAEVSEPPADADKEGDKPPDRRTRWTVALTNEVTGLLDVAVNFVLPIEADTAALDIPRISTDAPEGYRAAVAIQNDSRHELSVADRTGLLDMPVSEQAAWLPEQVRRSLQYVFKAFADDWSARLNLKQAAPASRVQAIIDLMAVTAVIDAAGRCRYQVKLDLQNRSEQFLPVKLPKGLFLWSASVAGMPVKPAVDPKAADRVLIPLVKIAPDGLPYDVTMFLAGADLVELGGFGQVTLPAVAIPGIEVVRTSWSVRLPAGFRYYAVGTTNMTRVTPADIALMPAQANVEQLKRYEQLNADKPTQTAARNWKGLLSLAGSNTYSGRTALTAREMNLVAMDNETVERLQSKATILEKEQADLARRWDRRRQEQAARGSGNVATVTNALSINGGTLELVRNQSLLAMPNFLADANKRQETMVQEAINGRQTAEKPGTMTYAGVKRFDRPGEAGKPGDVALPLQAEGDIFRDQDKDEKVARMVRQSQADRDRQVADQQRQAARELDQLRSNRATRMYEFGAQLAGQADASGWANLGNTAQWQGAAGNFVTLNGGALTIGDAASVQPLSFQTETTGQLGGVGLVKAGAGTLVLSGDGRYSGETTISAGALRAGQDGALGTGAISMGDTTGLGGAGFAAYGVAEAVSGVSSGTTVAPGQPAVAAGTFSLPVELPAGQVRLDFAGQGGAPRIELLVVKTALVQGAFRTGIIFALLALVWLVSRAVLRFRRREAGASPMAPLMACFALAVLVVLLAVAAAQWA